MSFLAHRPALILFGALGGIYLEDVNDDPERADEWDAADEKWLDGVRSAYRTISSLAGGSPARLTRRQRGWIVVPEPEFPRDMLSALATFGTDAIVWMSLSELRPFLSDRKLTAVLEHAPWWIAHGYKEAFLTVGTRVSIESFALTLDAAIDKLTFIPYRVRAHAKGTNAVVVTEGLGSRMGQIVSSYGPSGPRGASGAASLGGSPSDPGAPVTHNQIVHGKVPRPDGTFEPLASQVYP